MGLPTGGYVRAWTGHGARVLETAATAADDDNSDEIHQRAMLPAVVSGILTFWRRNYFFLILAHPVYKMWIIQEPNTLELWNKLHFEVEKNGEYIPWLKYSVPILVE